MFENPKNCLLAAQHLRRVAKNPKVSQELQARAKRLAHNLERLGWRIKLENEPPAGSA